jgi:hypothetical protein
MIDARLVRVGEQLATALVHAFLGHIGHCRGSKRRRGHGRSYIETRVLGLFSPKFGWRVGWFLHCRHCTGGSPYRTVPYQPLLR